MSMKKLENLEDLFQHQIMDLYSAEVQLTNALPKMAKKASNEKLKKAIENHLEETKKQKERLEKIGEICNFKIKGEKCAAMEGLIKEGEEVMEKQAPDAIMDAALIAAAQRVEHYEISGYGTASTYAKMLNYTDAHKLLNEILEEEKNADSLLNEIAISTVNQEAERSSK
jgi:ferritin-like metal-binding protein YciE